MFPQKNMNCIKLPFYRESNVQNIYILRFINRRDSKFMYNFHKCVTYAHWAVRIIFFSEVCTMLEIYILIKRLKKIQMLKKCGNTTVGLKSSEQVWECGKSFCQMLACEEGVYFKTVPIAQIINKLYTHPKEGM